MTDNSGSHTDAPTLVSVVEESNELTRKFQTGPIEPINTKYSQLRGDPQYLSLIPL